MTGAGKEGLVQFKPDDTASSQSTVQAQAWKILIVDDDEEVHAVTKLVLRNKVLLGRPLSFLSAFSASEARAILAHEDDIAVVLLDVVMETDDAGLDLVQWIRDEQENRHVRIILRTGQPGQAPEEEVITRYEINDYKEKTELTRGKLLSSIITALRGYKDICIIEQSKNQLASIVNAAPLLFKMQSVSYFSSAILDTLRELLRAGPDGLVLTATSSTQDAVLVPSAFRVIAATGRFSPSLNRGADSLGLPAEDWDLLRQAMSRRSYQYQDGRLALYCQVANRDTQLVYLADCQEPGELDRKILALFHTTVRAAHTNLSLLLELEQRLDEKSILVREIHHRVKNNLQIILSLVDLSDPDPDNQALAAIRRRIGAMAVIHDRVSNLRSEKKIDFQECAPDIAADVAHGFSREGRIPTIMTETTNFILPLEEAVPCSLLIEELLTFAVQRRRADTAILLLLTGQFVTNSHNSSDVSTSHEVQVWFEQEGSQERCEDFNLKLAQRIAEQLRCTQLDYYCDEAGKSRITCLF